MEELENGNTKTDDEKQSIELKNTPYEISQVRDFPTPENEDDDKEILVTEVVTSSYSEKEVNDTANEVVVENETETDLEETNEVSVFPVSETKETVLLHSLEGNIGASSDSVRDRDFVFGENSPRSKDSKNIEEDCNTVIDTENHEMDQYSNSRSEDSKNVEEYYNTVTDIENREIDQHTNSRSENSLTVEKDHNTVIDTDGDRSFVFGENIPISENSKNVEEDNNIVIDTENREINQHPISANPSLAQRTSWGGCCGLFEYLRRSRD